MSKITDHFSTEEMFCHCPRCKGKTPPAAVVKNLTLLAQTLEKFRGKWGAITVDNAYRCPAHNKEVRGAKGSFHMTGLAADIIFGDRKEADMFFAAAGIPVKAIPAAPAKGSLFKGVGYYPNKGFCHVDIARVKPRPNTWKG